MRKTNFRCHFEAYTYTKPQGSHLIILIVDYYSDNSPKSQRPLRNIGFRDELIDLLQKSQNLYRRGTVAWSFSCFSLSVSVSGSVVQWFKMICSLLQFTYARDLMCIYQRSD
jgi:hypothetical protein